MKLKVTIMDKGWISSIEVNPESFDVDKIVDDYIADKKKKLLLGLMVDYESRKGFINKKHFGLDQLDQAKKFMKEVSDGI